MLGSVCTLAIGPVAFPGLCREVKPGVDPVTPGAAPWLRLSPTPSLLLLPPPWDRVGSFLVLSCVLIGLLYAVPPVSCLVPLRCQCCLHELLRSPVGSRGTYGNAQGKEGASRGSRFQSRGARGGRRGSGLLPDTGHMHSLGLGSSGFRFRKIQHSLCTKLLLGIILSTETFKSGSIISLHVGDC